MHNENIQVAFLSSSFLFLAFFFLLLTSYILATVLQGKIGMQVKRNNLIGISSHDYILKNMDILLSILLEYENKYGYCLSLSKYQFHETICPLELAS